MIVNNLFFFSANKISMEFEIVFPNALANYL